MPSPIIIITAIESSLGAVLTAVIVSLILMRGRKAYHYVFAAFLLLCFAWDVGTFLLMIRNTHTDELPLIGYLIGVPCGFIPALIFHFANLYTGRKVGWTVVLGWVLSAAVVVMGFFGLYWKIDGVYAYSWGNVFKVALGPYDTLGSLVWMGFGLPACWLLYRAAKQASTPLEKRHCLYILAGLLIINVAVVKVGVVIGINVPILLPLGMFFVDAFNAIVGIAIIKDRLFDVTPIISKGMLYSAMAAVLIFIYSFSEHILVTSLGKLIGERSAVVEVLSVAVGIAVLLPLKRRLEHGIDGYFAQKRLQF